MRAWLPHPWSVPALPLGWKVRPKSDRRRQRAGQVRIELHLRGQLVGMGVVPALAAEKDLAGGAERGAHLNELGHLGQLRPDIRIRKGDAQAGAAGHRGVHGLSHGDGILQRTLRRLNEGRAAGQVEHVL